MRNLSLDNITDAPIGVNGESKSEATAHARELLELVGLADKADAYPAQLSGGQQQRVAIARALVNNPKIILADEPTGNLDTHTGELILALFRRLAAEGRTVILVTHNPEIAAVTPRRIEIRNGKIAQQVDAKLAGLDRVSKVTTGGQTP
jgi:putative ABC transport system ATP-binding protein